MEKAERNRNYQRKFRETHKEKEKERHRRYNQTHKEQAKQYRETHKERIKEIKRKYNHEHPERVKKWSKNCQKKRMVNPILREKYIKYQREHRKSQLAKMKKLIGYKCLICGSLQIRFHEIYGKKHLSATSGVYVIEHYQDFIPLCFRCHRAIHKLAELNNAQVNEILRYANMLRA